MSEDLRAEVERLRAAIRQASDVLYGSFGKPGKEVARAAGQARKILDTAVPVDRPPKD